MQLNVRVERKKPINLSACFENTDINDNELFDSVQYKHARFPDLKSICLQNFKVCETKNRRSKKKILNLRYYPSEFFES